MILYLSFEELSALRSSIEHVLEADARAGYGIAAPPQVIADLEQLAPNLIGDISIATFDYHARTRAAIAHLVQDARARMDAVVVDQHPSSEYAVAGYFEYAYLLGVLHRLDAMRDEMAALVQIVTGDDPDSEAARRFSFPD